jgi:hypothetical protein
MSKVEPWASPRSRDFVRDVQRSARIFARSRLHIHSYTENFLYIYVLYLYNRNVEGDSGLGHAYPGIARTSRCTGLPAAKPRLLAEADNTKLLEANAVERSVESKNI